jgi:hypothetical protein
MVSLLPAKIILLLNKRRTIPVDKVWEGWKAMKPASHPCVNAVRGFLVEHDFEYIGPRSMLLNANTLSSMPDAEPMILLAIEDITEEDDETLRSFAKKIGSGLNVFKEAAA